MVVVFIGGSYVEEHPADKIVTRFILPDAR
jgi:hypothetical protein